MESAQQLLRKHLADDYYWGKKAYLTCYCENEFRPKFPSQEKNIQASNPGGMGSAQKGGASVPVSDTVSN